MELISIHIPKTAGTAVRNVLRQLYGADLVEDYTDRPLDPQSRFHAHPRAWRKESDDFARHLGPGYRAVHGHFAAIKYANHFSEARRIVWLREPISWLISLYYFWKNLPRRANTLHHRLLDEGLSFIEFTELPETQNRFSQVFLKETRLDQLDFVGLQEHFDEDFAELVRLMDWPEVVPEFTNANPQPSYREYLRALRSDPALIARLTRLNAEDVELYRQALALRRRRMLARA
jgi:Sulfotransferase family